MKQKTKETLESMVLGTINGIILGGMFGWLDKSHNTYTGFGESLIYTFLPCAAVNYTGINKFVNATVAATTSSIVYQGAYMIARTMI